MTAPLPPAPAWSRRQQLLRLLGTGAAAAGSSTLFVPPSFAGPDVAVVDSVDAANDDPGAAAARELLKRLAARRGEGVRQPPPPLTPWGAGGARRQLEYPRWLFGEWEVASTFAAFAAPLGDRYVSPALLAAARAPREAGGLGSEYAFKLRFFSTLPDTFANQLRVAAGALPRDAVVADRAYNARAAANAYLGDPGAVRSVEYDPRDAPDRLTLTFNGVAADMRPLPPARAELFTQAARSAEAPAGVGSSISSIVSSSSSSNNDSGASGPWPPPTAPLFVEAQLFRQVTLGVRRADVQDYETVTAYALLGAGRVAARQRTLIYLEPRDELFFAAGGRAVAVYDYVQEWVRVAAPEGATACVETPKRVVQCI